MKIILNQDMNNLGEEGDICNVARGYARNFLFPKGIAVPVTRENKAILEQKKAAIEKRKEEKRNQAMDLKERIQGLTLTIERPVGDTGRLFASVTNAVIADALEKEGVVIDKKKIDVSTSSIKMIGKYTVKIKLYANENAEVKIDVVPSEETKKKSGKSDGRDGKRAETEKVHENQKAEEKAEELETAETAETAETMTSEEEQDTDANVVSEVPVQE